MKKSIKIVTAVTAVILAAILIMNIPFVKARLYFGDRITGTFNISVNGVEYIPADTSWQFDNGSEQELNGGAESFSIKGGEYGTYNIIFTLDNSKLAELTGGEVFSKLPENTRLVCTYVNDNRQNITSMNLTADLSQKDGRWVLKIKAQYSKNIDGNTIDDVFETQADYIQSAQNGEIQVHFGI